MSLPRAVVFCVVASLFPRFDAFVSAETKIPVIDIKTGRIAGPAAEAPSRPSFEQPQPRTNASMDPRVRAATVRLTAEGERGTGCGSGTIVTNDGKEALIVTCGHIFRGISDESVGVTVFTDAGERQLAGRVLAFDLESDVGVVSVAGVGSVRPIPIANRGFGIVVGSQVIAAGCDRGGSPKMELTTINATNRYHGPENINVTATPPHGRSGGGLITADYTLVGVCNGIDTVTKDGIYASLACVYRELAKAQIELPDSSNAPRTTVAASHEVAEREAPRATTISKRELDLEVICIIGSSAENGQVEVLHLHNASDELLAAIRREIRNEKLASDDGDQSRR